MASFSYKFGMPHFLHEDCGEDMNGFNFLKGGPVDFKIRSAVDELDSRAGTRQP